MSFVDGRVIEQRMRRKDARMARELRAKVRKIPLSSQGESARISGAEDAQTSTAPNPSEQPSEEVPILAIPDSTAFPHPGLISTPLAAEMYADWAHRNDLDKHGYPYILHLRRVRELCVNASAVVAYLHDVIEDHPELADDLRPRVTKDVWFSRLCPPNTSKAGHFGQRGDLLGRSVFGVVVGLLLLLRPVDVFAYLFPINTRISTCAVGMVCPYPSPPGGNDSIVREIRLAPTPLDRSSRTNPSAAALTTCDASFLTATKVLTADFQPASAKVSASPCVNRPTSVTSEYAFIWTENVPSDLSAVAIAALRSGVITRGARRASNFSLSNRSRSAIAFAEAAVAFASAIRASVSPFSRTASASFAVFRCSLKYQASAPASAPNTVNVIAAAPSQNAHHSSVPSSIGFLVIVIDSIVAIAAGVIAVLALRLRRKRWSR